VSQTYTGAMFTASGVDYAATSLYDSLGIASVTCQ
jgi:hypothetical protein